ncbi:MAG: hypothetical protein KYX67_01000 [Brevundimonas sp.]|jgi:hypothetical protein|uniref:Uncharacterized protein n=1 Tax=Brevundimonas mediterranea TaxID=74329 RepID=A0A7W6EYG6_9CAUL|nr:MULTISPECIES: hypothetical protein [Brevundimonas]MBB3870925.1 hypothetical protein [Brevundimonas mediterranea]MDK2745883.1 hypothetical protein [Brevundimonas sp.]
MIGDLLYHLHRHVRLVLIAGGLGLVVGMAFVGYEVARSLEAPSAHPARTGRA